MSLPKSKRRAVILQKLRQSHGANYLLCQHAADEIQALRKECSRLTKENMIIDGELASVENELALERR